MNTFAPIKSNTKDTKQVIINAYNDLLGSYNNICESYNLLNIHANELTEDNKNLLIANDIIQDDRDSLRITDKNNKSRIRELEDQNSALIDTNNDLCNKIDSLEYKIRTINKDRTDLNTVQLQLQNKLDRQNKLNDEFAENLNKRDCTINILKSDIRTKETIIFNCNNAIKHNSFVIDSLKKRCKLYKNLFILMVVIVCLMFIINLVL